MSHKDAVCCLGGIATCKWPMKFPVMYVTSIHGRILSRNNLLSQRFFSYCCCIATVYSAWAALGHAQCSLINLLQADRSPSSRQGNVQPAWFPRRSSKLDPWPLIPSWAGAKLSGQYQRGGAGSSGKVVPRLWEPSPETGSLRPAGVQRSPAAVHAQLVRKDSNGETLLQTAGMAARGQRWCFLFNEMVASISLLRGCLGKSSHPQNRRLRLGYVVLWHSQSPVRDHLASPCMWRWVTLKICLATITVFIFRHKLH